MIVSSQYKTELDKNSYQTISSGSVNQYYKNLGLSFEFTVNSEIMKLKEFFLYWKAPITISSPIKWSLCGPFIQDKSITLVKEERDKYFFDQIVITPYAAIVLEANTYGRRAYQTSGDDWNYQNSDGFYKTLPNPLSRVRLHVAITQQILDYYGVILPVVGKVVLMNDVDLSFIHGRKDEFVKIENLTNTITSIAEEAPKNTEQALRLVKSFLYNSLPPIAYDGNPANWRI